VFNGECAVVFLRAFGKLFEFFLACGYGWMGLLSEMGVGMFHCAFLLAFFSSLLIASSPPKVVDQRPEVPKAGIDLELFGAQSPRDFFERRAADSACVSDLNKAKAAHRASKVAIDQMLSQRKPNTRKDGQEDAAFKLANDALDAREKQLRAEWETVLETHRKCGECTTREVQYVSVKPAANRSKELWLVTDGSCQIPSKEPAVLKGAYEKIADSLLYAKRFLASSDKGFTNVLDFQLVDKATLEFAPSADRFPTSPVNLGIWVLGSEFPGIGFLAFRYFIQGDYRTRSDETGRNEFALSFSTTEDATVLRKIKFPADPKALAASGRPLGLKVYPLQNVRGLWYVDSDGYIRYHMAAVLPFSTAGIMKAANDILLGTLLTLSDRGEWSSR
jgi:hypothetical protein